MAEEVRNTRHLIELLALEVLTLQKAFTARNFDFI